MMFKLVNNNSNKNDLTIISEKENIINKNHKHHYT
jgi:hypothetical protein